MRQEAVVNPQLYDGDAIYGDYLSLFEPGLFVQTERNPDGRYPIIKLDDECWERPEDSFILEPLTGMQHWEPVGEKPARYFLIHPESYTKLVLFMQRTRMIDPDMLISPTVKVDGEDRFIFNSEGANIFDEKDFALKMLGKFEVFEDEKLWEMLEQDAVAYDDAMVDTFVGLKFRGGYLKELLSKIRQEGTPTVVKGRVGILKRFFKH